MKRKFRSTRSYYKRKTVRDQQQHWPLAIAVGGVIFLTAAFLLSRAPASGEATHSQEQALQVVINKGDLGTFPRERIDRPSPSLSITPETEFSNQPQVKQTDPINFEITNTKPTVKDGDELLKPTIPSIKWNEIAAKGILHVESQSKHPALVGSFAFPSQVKGIPVIMCDYRIPLKQDGSPLETAPDMVAVFPYPTEKIAVEGPAKVLADLWGFTIFSLRFPGMDKENGSDKSTYYYFPESGSGKAYVEAAEKIREFCGFPKRKIFVTGRSGGGSSSHLFANAYPDLVEGVAQPAARIFPDNIVYKGPMLIMYGEHDYVAPNVISFHERLTASSIDHVLLSFRPNWKSRGKGDLWTHDLYERPTNLIWAWFSDIANVRIKNSNQSVPIANWIKNNGLKFPGNSSLEAWQQFPKPTEMHDEIFASYSLSRPVANRPIAGVVILALTNAEESPREAMLDAEFLADQGYQAIAVTRFDNLDNAINKILGQAFRSLEGPSAKAVIVQYGNSKKAIDLDFSISKRILGYIYFSSRSPKVNSEKFAKYGQKALWIRSQAQETSISNENVIQKKYQIGGNLGVEHSNRCNAMLPELKLLFK